MESFFRYVCTITVIYVFGFSPSLGQMGLRDMSELNCAVQYIVGPGAQPDAELTVYASTAGPPNGMRGMTVYLELFRKMLIALNQSRWILNAQNGGQTIVQQEQEATKQMVQRALNWSRIRQMTGTSPVGFGTCMGMGTGMGTGMGSGFGSAMGLAMLANA